MATRDVVPRLNSSAPINAAIATSLPVFIPPSVLKTTFCLKPFNVSTWFTSVKPISQGMPAYLTLV